MLVREIFVFEGEKLTISRRREILTTNANPNANPNPTTTTTTNTTANNNNTYIASIHCYSKDFTMSVSHFTIIYINNYIYLKITIY